MQEYSYIGKGKVFLAKRGDPKLRYVGNSDKVELSFSEETKELKDFTPAGGGISNSVSRIDKVEISLNLFDYSPDNLALAMFGESSVAHAGKVTKEEHVAFKNHLIRLQHSHIHKVIVKDLTAGITYKEGVDFEVVNSGIIVLETGNIVDNSKISIDYEHKASNIIQSLVNSSEEYHFIFDGLNEAQSGKKVVLEIYRVKFTPAASLSFISDDFGNIEIKGLSLADSNYSPVIPSERRIQ